MHFVQRTRKEAVYFGGSSLSEHSNIQKIWQMGYVITCLSLSVVFWTTGLPGRGKRCFLRPLVQASSEAHSASSPMGTGGPFAEGKVRPGRDADHAPLLVAKSRISRSYTSSSPCLLHDGSGTALLFISDKRNIPRSASIIACTYYLKCFIFCQ
jgi:hypothetical protein